MTTTDRSARRGPRRGPRGRRGLAAILAFALPALAAAPPSVGAEEPASQVETRQRLMVSLIRAAKVPRAMVAGERPHDPAAVREAMAQVIEATRVLPMLFGDDAGAASATRASAASHRDDFLAGFPALEREAVAMVFAAEKGPEALAFAYDEFIHVCDSCHESFRQD